MPKFILIAMNGPTPDGDDQALTKWYNEIHMQDLKSIPGITSARRYKTVRGMVPGNPELWPYVAVYEIEADSLESISTGMQTNVRPFHPDFDRSRSGHIFAMQISGDE